MIARSRRILFLAFGIAAMASAVAVSVHTDWRRYSLSAENAFFDGDYAFAEKQVLSATVKAEAFGPQDQRLASALTDLASFYYFVGRYRRAEELFKRAIAIEQVSLGAGHPQIAANMFDLVNVYAADSRLGEARSVAERALAIQTRAVGTDHRSLADGLDIYANVLEKAGRFAEAEAARRRATEILLGQAPAPSTFLR
ncbi:MAG: tetratricopeptide repeat protein [Alphaproteobacteria bacterium]